MSTWQDTTPPLRAVRTRRAVASLTGGLLVAGLATAPATAAPGTAPAAPGTAATTAVPSVTTAAPAADVTVRPDPSYAGQPFEGWGTSLVWFANATGDYPDEIRDRLADMVFGDEGLNLNIARYNVGGGNAPDVPDYLRAGGAVDGWWNAPEGTTRDDVDWWDPEDPADWDLDADATQRWWVDRIKDDVTHWETFSNSPPWFMTESGYVSGNFDADEDQLKPESIDDFAQYLVGVTERLEDAHGIDVDTIDPFNEPNTDYWGTQLGADGNPTGGRQEGAHMGPALQQQVLPALASALQGSGTDAVISAMDETNPGRFASNWNAYAPEVRDLVDQLNVHTYGTGQRTTVRDIAKGEDKPLWMSEVGGSWSSTGQDFESMESGLGSAQHIVDDLRELEPSAWVFWQPVEDYDNMAPGGESPEGGNWGEIQIPFSCTAEDTLETCPIYTNTKYWVTQNFTHFIAPGDRLVGVDDPSSTAAVSASGDQAVVVHVNDETSARTVALDLSGFGEVADGATVTPVVTDSGGYLVEGDPVPVETDGAARATLTVPAESVTTFVVDGVSGVADDAPLAQDGHVYRIDGVQSDRSLAPAGDGVQIATDDPAAADQLWTLTDLGAPEGSGSHRTRYAVTNAATGEQLAVDADTSAVLVEAPAGPADTPEAARWILSTTGDGTYTLVNASSGTLLEVGGQATADGSPVGTYLANSGANQRWAIVDETLLGTEPVDVFTTPGTAPELPESVTPVYPGGAGDALPVTWDVPEDSAWAEPGTVEVTGTVTNPAGGTVAATATVTVDVLASTRTASASTYAGGVPELPATVTAVTAGGVDVERAVTWEQAADGVYDEIGVVQLSGTADAGAGDTLPATVRVLVTEPGEANAATADGTTVEATYTEPGYPAERVVNGDVDDKGWSNWRSGDKNPTDTLTVTLPEPRDVTGVDVHFYVDGSHRSWARTVQVEARVDGAWQAVGDPAEPASGAEPVAVDADVRTDAVRVVMTAHEATHLVVSEIEVLAKVPGDPSPVWDGDATYTAGDAVFHDGSYHAAQWWTRDEPGSSVWGSWQETVRAASGEALWTPSRVFTAGDVVVHDGETYVAQWWTRDQEPGDAHGPWAPR
ncbi:O-glycosyl hydrolase [Isoptericola sp. CG 20/1183]|uniref:O-glycosyl hydrolase n=1 Tax=Isoptericola halotolerans TaxID=300560 RepID=A0ABX5EI48_9MICO|nr:MULTISPECIES: RICIN domain-containing protein [Isoptericola]PRZ04187.1 O-glycosyl hydrolase [Isoptericola sp. CG 20/1183]PRZ09988.1 O-glycosyl hydrolase [Isoptericola halotolerans]